MKRLIRFSRLLAAWLACLTWLLPPGAGIASETTLDAQSAAAGRVYDVQLDAQGTLKGQLLDPSGAPVVGQQLVLQQGETLIGRALTDDRGEFAFARIRGGVYRLALGRAGTVIVCRAWTGAAAPPAAGKRLSIVTDPQVVRGQQPIGALLSHPLLVGLIVAAAIAIPVVIHNSQDDAS